MTAIEVFAGLWDGSQEGWVLLSSGGGLPPLIANPAIRTVLVVEDRTTYEAVVRRMEASGVPVLDDLP
jgi:hypothetical protein